MPIDRLRPTIENLSQESVLIQAWKKASSYIRYHNWFSDTFELDRAAINLPDFIAGIRDEIRSGSVLPSRPLRMVPAPKSQPWRINKEGRWEPVSLGKTASKIRPLAHVTLKDQVIATAMMLCLADRVETRQGDPRIPLDAQNLNSITSYGNRVFCDVYGGELRHRWGSSKLYRGFYEDYQTFLARPESIAEPLTTSGIRTVIIQSDLRQFYDRVTPDLLCERVREFHRANDENSFFEFFERFMDWRWSSLDFKEVQIYAKQAGLRDFTRISLPQGLVASGFFANVTLLRFDEAMRARAGLEILPGVILRDTARYVDDLRLVATVTTDASVDQIQADLFAWLKGLISETAPGLAPAEDKTRASVSLHGCERCGEMPSMPYASERFRKRQVGEFEVVRSARNYCLDNAGAKRPIGLGYKCPGKAERDHGDTRSSSKAGIASTIS